MSYNRKHPENPARSIRCPACGCTVKGFIPRGGDGLTLRTFQHHQPGIRPRVFCLGGLVSFPPDDGAD